MCAKMKYLQETDSKKFQELLKSIEPTIILQSNFIYNSYKEEKTRNGLHILNEILDKDSKWLDKNDL